MLSVTYKPLMLSVIMLNVLKLSLLAPHQNLKFFGGSPMQVLSNSNVANLQCNGISNMATIIVY